MKYIIIALLGLASRAESLSYWGFYKPKLNRNKSSQI